MRRKLIAAALAGVVIVTAWCFHKRLFGDDQKRVEAVIIDMKDAAEKKDAQRLMGHFANDYKDESGNNKFILFQMVKRMLDSVDEIKIDVKDVDVLVTGDSAYATVTVTSQAVKGGRVIFPFGSDQDPETPRLTLRKTATGDWEIVKVENVKSSGF